MTAKLHVDSRGGLAAASVPDGPALAQAAVAPRESGLLGRSAALLHALGLFAALVAALVSWLVGVHKDESYTIQGVGGAAALALAFWSVVLAMRALRKGEPKRWALTIAILFVLEMGVIGALQWDFLTQWGGLNDAWFTWGAWIGLPAWGPSLLLAAILAAPVAVILGHAAERQARQREDARWTVADRRRVALRAFWIVAGALWLPVFCLALYLYSAAMCANLKGASWQARVVRFTPDFLKNGVNALVECYDGPRARSLRFSLVLGGELPADGLYARLNDHTPRIRDYAWKVLCANEPQRARAMTLDPEAFDRVPTDVQALMAESLARDGSEEELRMAFGFLERAHSSYVEGYFKALMSERRTAILPDLLDFAARTKRRRIFIGASDAVWSLTQGGEWRKYWTTMLGSPREETRRWAVDILLKRPACMFRNDLALDLLQRGEGPGSADALVLLARNRGSEWDLARCSILARQDRERVPARLMEAVRQGDPIFARMAAHTLAGLEGRELTAGPALDACLEAYLKQFETHQTLPAIGDEEKKAFEPLMQEGDAWMKRDPKSP